MTLNTRQVAFGPAHNSIDSSACGLALAGGQYAKDESGEASRLINVANAIAVIDIIAHETLLFAAIGIIVGGIDDIAVDLAFLARSGWRRLTRATHPGAILGDFAAPQPQGRIAIFVAAWDEAEVIGALLTTALERIDYPDYRIYVGTYFNDRATFDAVAAVAERDARVRLVVGNEAGPTTKAANLNVIWRALGADEAREGAAGGVRARTIVLHDAEDVVHPHELRIFDRLIGHYSAVQLPVLPIVKRGSPLVSGHYCDEFAESHAKQMVVREALGVGLPLAGVGCAIAREALEAIAAANGGAPFDAHSLTEDYELGLKVAALGGRTTLARVRESRGGPLVGVQAYFPDQLDAAVRQKARWMVGIALAGWDRVGWGNRFAFGDHWMRMRDRRGPLSVVVLAAAYIALVTTGLSLACHAIIGSRRLLPALPDILLMANGGLLLWRLVMRFAFTSAAYGGREGLWSIPRAFVGNIIALLAARRAIQRYIAMLRGAPIRWDKTAHAFPGFDGGRSIGRPT